MNYDIIVLGAGSAGLNFAFFFNRLKLKVLVVEKHKIGGDCLNYGCVPSKALISLAHHIYEARKAEGLGVTISGSVNLAQVAAKIEERIDIIRQHENPEYLRKQGMDVVMGSPKFTSKRTISVDGKEYTGRVIIIATGSRPAVPSIPGIEKAKCFTNETIFANEDLPKRLLVIGGGPIAVELGQSYQRLGSQVTMISRDRILAKEDPEVSTFMTSVLEREGVAISQRCSPEKFIDANTVEIKEYNREERKAVGPERTISFDACLVAAGRTLNIDGLDLEKAGVEVKNGRIVIDDYLRTTNKHVYVTGDAAGHFQFTHWAETEAALVIKNLLSPFKKKLDKSKIAWVTYSDPEVATFGMQVKDLKREQQPHETIRIDLTHNDRAITEGANEGFLKVHIHKNKILGGVVVGKNAGEYSGELIGAMTLGIPFTKLFERIYPYPTLSRANRKAIQQQMGKKLTPKTAGILAKLYRFLNK